MAAILNNKKVQDNLSDGYPFPYTVADAEKFLDAVHKSGTDDAFRFAVAVDEKAVGSVIVLRRTNIHRRTGELGYYVAEEYWGKGVCTTAVRLICRYVFENSDIIRIFAEPFAQNAASCRVLEKAGFVCEGTLQANAVKNGEVIDMKLYALVKKEVTGE
ncbi:N-acetyltransferase [Clostridia bacterium]|nr:N-acetyltransferase [Clostridia bacterium]